MVGRPRPVKGVDVHQKKCRTHLLVLGNVPSGEPDRPMLFSGHQQLTTQHAHRFWGACSPVHAESDGASCINKKGQGVEGSRGFKIFLGVDQT